MNLNCIIVDDEPMARKVLEEYIEDVDFLILIGKAENPVKATTLLDNNKVDLMFHDINMPRMNGIEFLQAIRQDSTLDQSIVFVLTTSNNEEDKLAAYDQHIAGYILKSLVGKGFVNLTATQCTESD